MKIFGIHIITDKKFKELLSWKDYNIERIHSLENALATTDATLKTFRYNYEEIKVLYEKLAHEKNKLVTEFNKLKKKYAKLTAQ